jgi:hypothetical protein
MTAKRRTVVVVDGSNLATEGRTTPSLRQLDECVHAFLEEYPDSEVIVVADATFEHRAAAEERNRFKEAELAGEIVTPPAGAIGRGDAFILKIAKRANAVVLSNDSFQEFHAEHPWLFEEGRLLGGKPVANVGWIFTPRNPVRGPRSRSVTAGAAKLQRALADGKAPKIGDVIDPVAAPARTHQKAAAAERATTRRSRTLAEAHQGDKPDEDVPPVKRTRSAKAASPRAAAEKKPVKAAEKKPAKAPAAAKAAKKAVPAKKAAPTATRLTTTKAAAKKAAPAKKAESGAGKHAAAAPAARSRTSKATEAPREEPKAQAARGGGAPRTRAEPVNTPRAFLALVSDHPLESTVDGEVVSFTSHGAMISVPVGRGMHVTCYAPLARLAQPAPTRARDVLKKGEHRTFRIVAFDAARRIAELSLL